MRFSQVFFAIGKNNKTKGNLTTNRVKEATLEDRAHQLEQPVGKITLDSESFKKPFRNDSSSLNTANSLKARK
jgi:hypothetical protein